MFENDRDYMLFEQEHLKAQLEEFIQQTPFDSSDFVEPEKKKTVRWDDSATLESSSSSSSEDDSSSESSFENNSFAPLMSEDDEGKEAGEEEDEGEDEVKEIDTEEENKNETKPTGILKQEKGKLFSTMAKRENVSTDTLIYKKDKNKSKNDSTKVKGEDKKGDVSSISTGISSVNQSTSCSDTSGGDDGYESSSSSSSSSLSS